MSSIGWSVCSSHADERDRCHRRRGRTPASTSGSVQPCAGPSMIPNSSEPRPMIDSAAPSGSSGASVRIASTRGRRSGRGSTPLRRSGRLTQNTALHEKCSSRKPPVTGPRATPSPEKPAQIAIARPRSRGSGKTLVRIDKVDGMISAPPMPMNAREAISWVGELGKRRSGRAEGEQDDARPATPLCARTGRRGSRWSAAARRRRACSRR